MPRRNALAATVGGTIVSPPGIAAIEAALSAPKHATRGAARIPSHLETAVATAMLVSPPPVQSPTRKRKKNTNAPPAPLTSPPLPPTSRLDAATLQQSFMGVESLVAAFQTRAPRIAFPVRAAHSLEAGDHVLLFIPSYGPVIYSCDVPGSLSLVAWPTSPVDTSIAISPWETKVTYDALVSPDATGTPSQIHTCPSASLIWLRNHFASAKGLTWANPTAVPPSPYSTLKQQVSQFLINGWQDSPSQPPPPATSSPIQVDIDSDEDLAATRQSHIDALLGELSNRSRASTDLGGGFAKGTIGGLTSFPFSLFSLFIEPQGIGAHLSMTYSQWHFHLIHPLRQYPTRCFAPADMLLPLFETLSLTPHSVITAFVDLSIHHGHTGGLQLLNDISTMLPDQRTKLFDSESLWFMQGHANQLQAVLINYCRFVFFYIAAGYHYPSAPFGRSLSDAADRFLTWAAANSPGQGPQARQFVVSSIQIFSVQVSTTLHTLIQLFPQGYNPMDRAAREACASPFAALPDVSPTSLLGRLAESTRFSVLFESQHQQTALAAAPKIPRVPKKVKKGTPPATAKVSPTGPAATTAGTAAAAAVDGATAHAQQANPPAPSAVRNWPCALFCSTTGCTTGTSSCPRAYAHRFPTTSKEATVTLKYLDTHHLHPSTRTVTVCNALMAPVNPPATAPVPP